MILIAVRDLTPNKYGLICVISSKPGGVDQEPWERPSPRGPPWREAHRAPAAEPGFTPNPLGGDGR